MYHYTYLLTNKLDDLHYIGVRSSKLPPKLDPYMSSSTKVSKDYLHNCRKSIISTFNTRKEAIENEIFWHNLLDVGANPLYFNAAKQTSTGFDVTGIPKTTEFKALVSKVHKGKIVSKESTFKQQNTVKERRANGCYSTKRKPITWESRVKMSKTHKHLVSLPGYVNPFQGRTHSEQTKQTISAKNKKAWEDNKTKSRTFKPWFIHNLDTGVKETFTTITKTEYAIQHNFHYRALLDAATRSKGVKPVKCAVGNQCIIGNI